MILSFLEHDSTYDLSMNITNDIMAREAIYTSYLTAISAKWNGLMTSLDLLIQLLALHLNFLIVD